MKNKVYLLHRLPAEAEAILGRDHEVEWAGTDDGVSVDRLVEVAARVDGLVPTVIDPIPAAVLEAGKGRLRIVANFGVGVDSIDLDAARRLGIVVTNTPGVLTDATADLTMALILMVLRRLGEGERLVRAGRWTGWRPTHLLGRQVTGLTLGIVGFGRIGRAVALRAHRGFGMRILYHNRTPVPESERAPSGAVPCALDELVARSDVVSLHTALTPETARLVDRDRLARFKPGAILINTARGGLVDEAALAAALEDRRLGGAGLDVYLAEPRVPDALVGLDNVVALPHLGSATVETRTAMGRLVADNLRAFFRGEPPPNRVA